MRTLGDDLIEALDELRTELDTMLTRLEDSGVERTQGLKKMMGKDCTYYRKSLDMFLRTDYMELKTMIESLQKKFDAVEGKKPSG